MLNKYKVVLVDYDDDLLSPLWTFVKNSRELDIIYEMERKSKWKLIRKSLKS
jgi:hypothetical protein